MDGIRYEKFCADYLTRHGYHNVHVTKSSHDQGIDIIAYRQRHKYGIQCKYYEIPVSNHSVMEAYTGGAYYGCDRIMVMTNSTFTASARQLAAETDVILLEKITDEKDLSWWMRYRLYCLPVCFFGIYLLFQLPETISDLEILHASMLVVCGLFGMGRKAVSLFFSILSALLFEGIHFVLYYNPQDVFFSFFLIYLSFFTIANVFLFQKAYRANAMMRILQDRQEMHRMMKETTTRLGTLFAELLSEEFHAEILYCDGVHHKDGSSTLTFRSRRKLTEDLALVEYSLNQLAQHEKIHDHYQLTLMNDHEFLMTIQH